MGSSVLRPRRGVLLARPSALTAALLLLLLGTSCQVGQPSPSEIPLDSLTCVRGDVPESYSLQASGDFSLGNLADLSSDPAKRRTELHAGGVEGGHFSTWRQMVGEPPFPPPIDVLCQVIRFGTATQAQAFVASLQPNITTLEDTAITWIPQGGASQVEETTPDQQSLPSGARAFHLTSANDETSVAIYAVIAATGPYVQTVWVGDRDGKATLAQATGLEAGIVKRAASAPPLTSASP